MRQLKSFSRVAFVVLSMLKLVWKSHPLGFLGLLLLEFVQGLLPLATAWVTKMLFDILAQSLQGKGASSFPSVIIFLLVIQGFLSILNQFVGQLNIYLNAGLVQRLTLTIKVNIYQKINSLIGLASFEVPEFHDRIRLATESAHNGPLRTVQIFTTLFRSVVTLLSFIGILLAFNPILIVIIIIAVVPQLFVEIKLGRQRFSLIFTNNSRARRASYLGNVLSGVSFAKEVRLFNLADYFLRKFRRIYEEIHHNWRIQQKRELRWLSLLSMISRGLYSGAFAIIVFQAFAGHLSIGDVTLYDNAVKSVQAALLGIISAMASLHESTLFFEHYNDLLKMPQLLPVATSPLRIDALKEGIELRNVSFRYSHNHPWILRNINLYIPAKQCTAIVGLNGAGKTTLVKLLTRCYDPVSGVILWDGVDIRELDPIQLRKRIGVVFQDFVRYDLTAQENIGFGHVENIDSLSHISTAAKQAGIYNVVQELPKGFQTTLSRWLNDDEVSADLSGGEWQKIAIARMCMRSNVSEFLILDEPTAALDALAEHELYDHFTVLMNNRTTLLISHRFSTVRMAHAIAVLEDRVITEYGTHEELISSGKTYARLYRLQAERFA